MHPTESTVLLVGCSLDPHIGAVQIALEARDIDTIRLDVDRPPVLGGLSFSPAETIPARSVFGRWFDPTRLLAQHNTRTGLVTHPWLHLDPTRRAFAARESSMAIVGLLGAIEAGRWVNGYWQTQRAEVKATQLRIASENGLLVPRSLISDQPDVVRSFFEDVDHRMVYKSLDDPFVHEEAGDATFLYTSNVTATQLERLEALLVHPCLFQERLPVIEEYRVTVVGDRVFAASIDSSCELDWRRSVHRGGFRRGELNATTRDSVVRTVDALELRFAAVDLARTHDGMYFLEANPSGAYSWLERLLDWPITDAVCDELLAR